MLVADLVASFAAACPVLAALLRQGPEQQQHPPTASSAAAAAGGGISCAGLLAHQMLKLSCLLGSADVQQPAALLATARLLMALLAALPNSSTSTTCTQQQQQQRQGPECSRNDTQSISVNSTTSHETTVSSSSSSSGGGSSDNSILEKAASRAVAVATSTAVEQTTWPFYIAALKSLVLQPRLTGSIDQESSALKTGVLYQMRSLAEAVVTSMCDRYQALPNGSSRGATAWEAYARSHQPALNDLGLLLYVHLAWLVQQQYELQETGSSSSRGGGSRASSSSSSSSSSGRQQQSIPAWHLQFLAAAAAAPWDPAWSACEGPAARARLHDQVGSALLALKVLHRLDQACQEGRGSHRTVCSSSGSTDFSSSSSSNRSRECVQQQQQQPQGCDQVPGSWIDSLPCLEMLLLLLEVTLLDGSLDRFSSTYSLMGVILDHIWPGQRATTGSAFTAAAATLLPPMLQLLGPRMLALAAAAAGHALAVLQQAPRQQQQQVVQRQWLGT
jgi:hypothetical protein